MRNRVILGLLLSAAVLTLSTSAGAQLQPIFGGSYVRTPNQKVLDGLTPVSRQQWGVQQVRQVLQTFAYGGQASDLQITVWASMAPGAAIVQILNFDPVNLRLSPQGADDPSTRYCQSLQEMQDFWSSDEPDNPMRVANRPGYATLNQANDEVSPLHLILAWSRVMHTPGCNRFLHKMALYLTNYHASIHIRNAGPSLIRSYYDDVVQALAGGADFVDIVTLAASHAALAMAYGHQRNYFDQDGEFFGNDDFAREYFQLLFRIQGTSEDPDYHEDVTIEHNAWLLTGMLLDIEPYAWGSDKRFDWFVAPIDFSNHIDASGRLVPNQAIHFNAIARDNSCLEILHQQICGATAQAKLQALGPVAAAHPESMANVPLQLIGFFGDDRLSADEITALQSAWASADYELLTFIRAYAISTQFLEGDAFKLRSAFDRNLAIQNLNQLTAEEAYAKFIGNGPTSRMFEQGAMVFAPIRDVFGGQTGEDATNDRYAFKSAWDANVTDPQFLAAAQEYYRLVPEGQVLTWHKDWGSVIPSNQDGHYVVQQVAEWLWTRFVGDGGTNFDPIARAQVYALLATGIDFGALLDADNPEVQVSSADIRDGIAGEISTSLATQSMDFSDAGADERVGMAINFITALPYTFVTGVVQ